MRQVKEMTVLHAAAIANAESATIDELIERVTQIVGNAIYPTHFGILVVDENIGVIHTHSSYRFRDSYKDLTLKIGEGITGTVALTGKPIRISDVRNEPIYVETDPMIRSELCVPVKIGKKVIAVINTEHEGVDAFTENDERLLLTIAGQMATAMARLRAEESLFKQVKELSVLHSVAIACVEGKSQDELIERITQIIGETLFSTNFGMMLIDEEEGLLKTHHSYRLWEGQEPMILELGHGITGWVAQHGKVLRVPDVTKEPLYVEGDIRTLSELAVPLKVGDKVIGTINTEHNKLNAYSEMDEKLLATFAGQLAPALERLRAEEALKEERDMAQNYLDIAGAILVAIDRDGKITLINKRGSDILGYRDIELIGKDWFDISLSEEEREKQRFSFRKKISGKKQPEEYYETNLKTRTGDKRIIVWRDSILRDDSGHIIGTLSSGEDITERKDLEQKLRVSEEEYRTLVENLNIGVYRNTADEKGRFLKANPAIARIFGYNSIAEFLETSVRDMYQNPGDRDDFIKELKSKGSITSRELKLKKKNGSPIIASVTATIQHNPNGEIKWIDGVIEDITEQKRAEDELLAEKERLAVTLRSIGEGVITVDIEGRIVLLNKVAEDLTGWKHTEAVGRKLEDVFCIEGEAKDELMPDPFSKVISSGIAISFPENTTLISKKGVKRIIAYNGAPIMDQNSEIIGVVLVFRDITEKMIIEEELQKAQKLESIGILAGGIAHDFNNILAAILGNLSLANLQINPKSKAYIHLIEAEKAVERARNLTTQLLTFSKGGAPIRETASIADLLIETVKFSLVGSNVESRFSFQDDLLSAKIDKGQISQVINNLVLNASQAMPDGGVIEVNASNIQSGSSEDTLSLEPGDFIKISIRDYGCGIPEEYLNKIFDPYYTTKETGSGLGLTTAYSIIHKHKGHISVESIVGMGTIFHVYLPATGEKLTKKSKPKINDLKGKGRILFMDDEIGIRNTIEDVIKHLGYSVKMTSDGEEMIKLYRESYNSGEPFDAVIMDLTVPGGLGGKDAINNLKEIDPNVKAIASSGYSNDPVMAQYEKFGFKGILVKPFNIHDVGNVLKKVLSE
jgi:PAS domain S-box-containing protein